MKPTTVCVKKKVLLQLSCLKEKGAVIFFISIYFFLNPQFLFPLHVESLHFMHKGTNKLLSITISIELLELGPLSSYSTYVKNRNLLYKIGVTILQ